MSTTEDSISCSANTPTDTESSLAYYKSQYEQLEAELADFQASSKELEAELEKDVEGAERRERHLQGKVESLGFEVEEWKVSWFILQMMNVQAKRYSKPVLNFRTDQIQAIESGSEHSTKHTPKRDHNPT